MDPEDVAAFLDKIHTTEESRADILRLVPSEDAVTKTGLDDEAIESELGDVSKSVVKPLISKPVSSSWGPFVLVSATGDPAYRSKPISISKASFSTILLACGLPSFTLLACGMKRFHLSHHVQYDDADGSEQPVALVLLLRIPRNSQSVSIAMRIRLADLATVAFVTSMSEETSKAIQERCTERRRLLARHPLYFLALVYEDRCADYKSWFDDILEEINVVESATGMTRNTWKMRLSPRLRGWLGDYDNLLRTLYASNTELSHFDTVTTFSVKLGDFLLRALGMLDELRLEGGLAPLPGRDLRALRERIAFTRSRCDLTADKTREMLERVKGQINVAFNLVAQRDSKVNLAVAEDSYHVATLAARDSETMKTITVLTLAFLPSTLVTSMWSADLFQLDPATNWKVYVGVTLALTAVVFAAWFLYLRYSSLRREERPLHIAGVGYIRGGKVVHTGAVDQDEAPVDIRRETNWHDK
ncbi:hypothetical protein KVR01_008929 [Diaporthe batatas]|uniref:uncharacterized protein n=1 Tax=Diaporthe batatas TaxID=748121 RepID=UPI001D037FEB|nr:uncharacterized protein KVR01_008929 [Diaporthe batatas]KAG8160665.1 hypothetical protein KVR01_008929 [Diaporthe batatas]